MIVKTYGLYDTVAKHVIQTFTAESDAVALRSCEYIIHDRNADIRKLRDCTVMYLYSFDTSTCDIVDSSKSTLLTFASLIDEQKLPLFNSSLSDELINSVKQTKEDVLHLIEYNKSFSNNEKEFIKRIDALDSKLTAVIQGDIVCQKKKKKFKI